MILMVSEPLTRNCGWCGTKNKEHKNKHINAPNHCLIMCKLWQRDQAARGQSSSVYTYIHLICTRSDVDIRYSGYVLCNNSPSQFILQILMKLYKYIPGPCLYTHHRRISWACAASWFSLRPPVNFVFIATHPTVFEVNTWLQIR